MKKLTLLVCAAIFATSIAAFAQTSLAPSPSATASAAGQKYTCPMHPEVMQDKPGKCPKCGMNLEPKGDKKPETPK
jgi:Heavy metal binding domain